MPERLKEKVSSISQLNQKCKRHKNKNKNKNKNKSKSKKKNKNKRKNPRKTDKTN